MSMNKFMHPRNIYKTPPNFNELSLQYPEFEKFVTRKSNGKIKFDFKNPKALRCLTLILLKKDFDLALTIPEKNLIPTLPLRLNYILWLEDLLNYNNENNFPVCGIDIGTGATCIYPLIASKKNGWKMIGTEIDKFSVETARENVKNNSLDDLITVKEVSKSAFLDGVVEDNEVYDFCMCNPPFFNIDAEIGRSNHSSESSCEDDESSSGTVEEIQTTGGEVEFIKNIIRDSIKLRDKIRIYTTMVGHKSSLPPLLDELKKLDIKSVGQTEFCQGRTVRWAIVWSLTEQSLKNYSPLSEFKLPKPVTWLFESKYSFKECAESVIPQLLTQLKIQSVLLEDFKKRKLWRLVATENTWTGARKKRRERLSNEKKNCETNEPVKESDESSKCDNNRIPEETLPNKSDTTVLKANCEATTALLSLKPRIKETCPKNDYCRQYALSEKRPLSSDDIEIPFEKCKSENVDLLQTCVLQVLFSVKMMQNKLELQILFEDGKKDAPQQILQFFKNNLAK